MVIKTREILGKGVRHGIVCHNDKEVNGMRGGKNVRGVWNVSRHVFVRDRGSNMNTKLWSLK